MLVLMVQLAGLLMAALGVYLMFGLGLALIVVGVGVAAGASFLELSND